MKACYDAGKQVLARRLPRDLPVKVIKWSSTVGGPTIHVPKTFARWHTHSWSLAVAKDPKVTSKQAIPSHPSRGRSSIQEGKALAATLPGAVYIQADCSSREGCEGLIQEVAEKCGQLDLLVCHSSGIALMQEFPMIFIFC